MSSQEKLISFPTRLLSGSITIMMSTPARMVDAKAKIKVIKEIRAIAGLGLKEAKELVESAPKIVQKELKQDKADELKAQLEAVGAEIEIV